MNSENNRWLKPNNCTVYILYSYHSFSGDNHHNLNVMSHFTLIYAQMKPEINMKSTGIDFFS